MWRNELIGLVKHYALHEFNLLGKAPDRFLTRVSCRNDWLWETISRDGPCGIPVLSWNRAWPPSRDSEQTRQHINGDAGYWRSAGRCNSNRDWILVFLTGLPLNGLRWGWRAVGS